MSTVEWPAPPTFAEVCPPKKPRMRCEGGLFFHDILTTVGKPTCYANVSASGALRFVSLRSFAQNRLPQAKVSTSGAKINNTPSPYISSPPKISVNLRYLVVSPVACSVYTAIPKMAKSSIM